jgi:undecaprenyl-diphosphatase
VLVAVVGLARVYVGAHLPLDVVGGAAVGWGVGSAVHLLLGAPGGRPSTARVRRALERYGIDAPDVVRIGPDTRRSAHFLVTGGAGGDRFVKVITRERRDTDLLYRAWRVLARRSVRRPARFGLPHQQVEHEAYMALLAGASGVRTPAVLLARAFGNGAGLLLERRVPGTSLAELDAGSIGDPLLAEIWRQVGILRAARIAHGDLEPTSIVVDDQGQPWLVDFDQAEAAASDERLDDDVAELLAGLARVLGSERPLRAATAALGPRVVGQALSRNGQRRGAGVREDLLRALAVTDRT